MSKEDQAQAAKVEGQSDSADKAMGLDESFDKGWEQVELITASENAEKGEKAKPGEAAAKPDEKKAPEAGEKKPIMVLKVQGKDVPVYTEAELQELAQKGADYTRKTQGLADDRRAAEAELKGKADDLNAKATELSKVLDRLEAMGALKAGEAAAKKAEAKEAGAQAAGETGAVSDEEAEIYKRFELDPANAYPHEKRMIRELHEVSRFIEEVKLERANAIFDKAVEEERENFPFDDIINDQGVDLTKKQIGAIVVLKRQQSGIQKPTFEQVAGWAREAVRELHDIQRKATNGSPTIDENMDPAEFVKLHPELFKKLKGYVAPDVIRENDSEKAKLPPTIKPAPRSADLRAKPKADAGERKSMEQYLDEGFKDEDILRALNPQV